MSPKTRALILIAILAAVLTTSEVSAALAVDSSTPSRTSGTPGVGDVVSCVQVGLFLIETGRVSEGISYIGTCPGYLNTGAAVTCIEVGVLLIETGRVSEGISYLGTCPSYL